MILIQVTRSMDHSNFHPKFTTICLLSAIVSLSFHITISTCCYTDTLICMPLSYTPALRAKRDCKCNVWVKIQTICYHFECAFPILVYGRICNVAVKFNPDRDSRMKDASSERRRFTKYLAIWYCQF